jgi:hypothetical protein
MPSEFACPLWVKSRHMQCNKPCPLYNSDRESRHTARRCLYRRKRTIMSARRAKLSNENSDEGCRCCSPEHPVLGPTLRSYVAFDGAVS